MKKFAAALSLCLLLCSSLFSFTAFAGEAPAVPTAEIQGTAVQPRYEETRWYYRIYNGVAEKRLWSITYSKCLTDWMPE